MIQFLPEGRSETMLHDWCGSGKSTTVFCFGIGGGDARVPAPFHTWSAGVFWSVPDVLSHYEIGVSFSFWYK